MRPCIFISAFTITGFSSLKAISFCVPGHVFTWLFAFSKVYDLLPLKELRGYSFNDYYLEEEDVNPCVSLDNILLNGFTYIPISPDGEGDAYDILKVGTRLLFLLYSFLE